MSVYDLYQSYLNQMQTPAPAAQSNILDPSYLLYLQQQQQGGGAVDDRFTNMVDPSQANAGITSFSGLTDYFTPSGMIGGALLGPIGAIAGRGIGSLVDRFRGDPYGGFNTRGISPDVQAAIEKDIQRESKDYGGGQGPSSPGRSDPYGGGPGGVQSF